MEKRDKNTEETRISYEKMRDFGFMLFMDQKCYFDSILKILYVDHHFPTGSYMQPAQLLYEKSDDYYNPTRERRAKISGAEKIGDEIRTWREKFDA